MSLFPTNGTRNYWVNGEGESIHIHKLEPNHLSNIILMLYESASREFEWVTPVNLLNKNQLHVINSFLTDNSAPWSKLKARAIQLGILDTNNRWIPTEVRIPPVKESSKTKQIRAIYSAIKKAKLNNYDRVAIAHHLLSGVAPGE